MNYLNNFKYGEISRKLAGSFDKELYTQGAFGYKNMITDSFGTASRRPPLKKMIDTEGLLDVREFKISESVQYLIGLTAERYVLYRYVLGELQQVTSGLYPTRADEDAIVLTAETAKEVRNAQYYERMYFVHTSFRPFYLEVVPASDEVNASYMEVILNQDAKGTYYFTPSYIENSSGTELTNLESRLVYKKEESDGTITWWFDINTEEEEYEYADTYPPVQGESSNISYYEDYEDDTLLTGEGHFPSVIAFINDSMYLAATERSPATMWKSRILGSSQYVEGYTAESMHDFVQFQMVATESVELVDVADMPMTEATDSSGNILYEENEYGVRYFVPDVDEDGNYTYETELFWKIDELNSEELSFYYERDGNDFYNQYDTSLGYPVKKPIMVYDLSDADALTTTKVVVSFVATDSTAARFEFNTGRSDKIMFIAPALGYIIVGTTTSEHLLSTSFSATNMSQTNYSNYGSYANYNVQPCATNASFFFLQKGRNLIEFYTYEGYMYSQDVSYLNHDILKGTPIQLIQKSYPSPLILILMDDGTLVTLVYDKNNGIQAFSAWDFPTRSIKALANYLQDGEEIMLALVEDEDGSQWIGYLDENEEEVFADEGDVSYLSEIETTYAEIIDLERLRFGGFKKATRAYIRPYKSGHIRIGDDKRQLVTSNYALESEDYTYALLGSSKKQYSIFIQSVDDEPMTILAFAFEVLN